MTTSKADAPQANVVETDGYQPDRPGADKPARNLFGFADPTARFVHRWTIALLVSNAGIVATGGAVRVTGSGLGCDTWPKCTDESFVAHPALGYHGAIEFGNRLLTWVLVVIAVATWIAIWRHRDSTRSNRMLATLIALGIPFQGVIGGITVLTDLNPWIVALHFLLSMVLVSGATVLVFRTRPYPSPRAATESPVLARLGRYLAWLIYVVTWATVYLGTVVTGSGPHAGDADVPRNGLSPTSATQLHADAVFILIGLTVAMIVFTRVAGLVQQRVAYIFGGLLALQGLIGVIQYATDLPIALVIAHMVGSTLLIVGSTWLILDFGRAEQSVEPRPEAQRA